MMRGPPKLISLLSSPRGRNWERGQLSPHIRVYEIFDLTNFVSYASFKNIKFPWGNYQTDSSDT